MFIREPWNFLCAFQRYIFALLMVNWDFDIICSFIHSWKSFWIRLLSIFWDNLVICLIVYKCLNLQKKLWETLKPTNFESSLSSIRYMRHDLHGSDNRHLMRNSTTKVCVWDRETELKNFAWVIKGFAQSSHSVAHRPEEPVSIAPALSDISASQFPGKPLKRICSEKQNRRTLLVLTRR